MEHFSYEADRDERDQARQDAEFDAEAAEQPNPCDCGGEWEKMEDICNLTADGDWNYAYRCSGCGRYEIVCVATRYSIPASAMGGRI